jgi:hypothetical protein
MNMKEAKHMNKKVMETLKGIKKANVWEDRTEYDKEDLAKAYPDLTANDIEELYSNLHREESPMDKEIVVEKIKNGEVKVKGKHQAIKSKECDICGEEGKLVQEAYTIHGRTFQGWICKAGTGCRAEEKVEKPKAEKAKPAAKAERENLQFTEAQLIAAVKAIGHEASSREISDKLGIKDADQGRGYVRTRMAALVKSKEIVTSKPNDAKSRCTFLYSIA